MPWSTSGTFTNESAKTVTAISSVTGGIRVSSTAHGYSNGDFIELVDLGGYNGAYIISNVQTDTFDIVNQLKQDGTFISYGSTDSGTCERGAKDFSGITGVTNVTRIVNDNNDRVYRSSGTSVEIKISGAICIDPKFETVILNRSVGNGKNALEIRNGGILQVGKLDLENSYYDYPSGVAFIFPIHSSNGSFTYQEGYSPFRTSSGGQLKWLSGTVYSSGVVAWYGKILCASQGCVLSSRNIGRPQIRQRSDDCIVKGLTTHDFKFTAIKNADEFAGYVPIQSSSAIDMSSSGSDNVWYTFYDLVAGKGNDKEVGIKNDMWARLVDVNKGSDIIINAQSTGSTNQKGICEIREELTLTTQKQSGTKINNCRVFIRDTNHSHRLSANTYNNNPDYTADRTYGGLTTAGKIAFTGDTGSILLTCYHRPDNGATANDVWDSRGNEDNKTDIFTAGFAKYGFISAKKNYELKGNGGVKKTFTLFEDTGITETNKTTVSNYTEIDNLNKLYDKAQQWVTETSDNMEEIGLGNMVVKKSGKGLDFGTADVYLDSSYSDVFKYIESSDKVEVKIGSGFSSTTKYNTIIGDVYLNDEIDLTNITITGDLHINTGANSELDFDNVTITGNITNDDSSHTLTINATNGSSVTTTEQGTGNGEVNIQRPVTLKVTALDDKTGSGINNAHVIIQKESDKTTVKSGQTNSSGIYEVTHYYDTDIPIVGWVRQWDLSGDDYIVKTFSGTITNQGLEINTRLTPI